MNRIAQVLMTTLVAAILLSISARAATESASDYAGALPLTTRPGEAMHRIELPVSVYAGVEHADLRDLRVFNAAGELVPYALASDRPAPPPPGASFTPPVFTVWGEVGKPPGQLDVRIEQREDAASYRSRPTRPGARRDAKRRCATRSPTSSMRARSIRRSRR